jgi:YYY domain-containing protein
LVLIELVTLVAFLAFVLVRLTNPDLWQPTFGGEKPMDFAYFNGVLRSTIFPPIDPWYTGGYINYYYFGFVIVSTPVLLLKMFPSIAYNLILPTLFALTGIAAFSVAFTLVHRLREHKFIAGDESGEVVKRARRFGNPWVAGIAALLLVVVLGNLDTPRVFFSGLARAGGYSQPAGIAQFLIKQYNDQFGSPDAAAMEQLSQEAQNPGILTQIRYEANNSVQLLTSIGQGIAKLARGEEVYISPERWFWGPTRVLAETPGVEGNAINEMPIFTYVYGDLHAHMISMPMQLIVMGLILNEVLLAGSGRRRRGVVLAAVLLIGIFVGMLRATNTWDWITYMILGVVGLGFAWLLSLDSTRTFWRRFTRRSLLDLAWYAGGFVAASFIAVIPYNLWFAQGYNRILPWNDGKTPLWAYFDIHGLFLFLVVSLLVWETARWLRSVYVRSLRGMWALLVFALLVVIALLVAAVALSAMEYQVTLVVLPLLIWIAILFFRSGQTRVMQFVLLLTGLALGLTLGVEIFVLDGDIGRQNTLFKFYIQAWLLLSVVGGTAFAWLIHNTGRWKPILRNVWTFVLVLLVGVAALMPLMAVRGKAQFRFDLQTCAPVTLDGMDFMKCAKQYEGNAEIMEGLSEDTQYHWGSRISIYTGLPAVLGWNWHQRQQRVLDPFGRIVETRNANVNAFYQTPSIGIAWDMIKHYNVSYVIVGGLERVYYNAEGLAKFDTMVEQGLLEPVFHEGSSTIYRVNPDAEVLEQG